jgi:16S rRNA (adenine1518-N6/adenine1519-N6)-dimethyltransferase
MARQRLGQHFLGASGWQKKIFATLPVGREDVWIEIGPGHGEMTRHLAPHARRLIAIEADARLAAELEDNVAQRPTDWPGVEIVPGDVLKHDLAKLAGGERFRVYGNLPYYITSPILHQLFAVADQIASIHIVMQHEVAARIVATPGHREYGYLSATCQFYARPKIALKIPPGAFRPPPKVQSALVEMTLPGERASLGIKDEEKFLKFIQLCFSQKRKTLRNNLRAIAPDETIHETLAAHRLPPDARAEQLSLAHFCAIFDAMKPDERAKTRQGDPRG